MVTRIRRINGDKWYIAKIGPIAQWSWLLTIRFGDNIIREMIWNAMLMDRDQ